MEGKKVLWVVFSIALALVVILAAGLFLLRPRQPKGAEASAGAPSLQGYDPYEYVRGTSAAPGLAPPPSESEPVVIVVGEPPGGTTGPSSAQPLEPGFGPAAVSPIAPQEAPVGTSPPPTAAPERARLRAAELPVAVKPAAKAEPQPAGARAAAQAPAKAAPRPKSVRVTEYWIQAGSFSSASRADEISRRLEERGLATRTTTRDLNGKTHFRVRVGPYTSKAEAEKFLGWIRELKGFESSYISMVASRRIMP